MPPASALPERAAGVLAVLYLLFNEGYSASAGAALVRRDLCDQAVRLASVLVELMPELAEARGQGEIGPYQLQAAIARCHALAPTADATDWQSVAWLYQQLADLTGSPVVELNRAVAVAMVDGPEEGLAFVDELAGAGDLDGYYLLPATRADLLRRLGRFPQAAAAYREALALVPTEPERRFLKARLAEVRPRP